MPPSIIPVMPRWFLCGVAATTFLLLPAARVLAKDEPVGPTTWPIVMTRGLFSVGGDFLKGSEPDRPFDVLSRGAFMLLEAGRVQVPTDFAFVAAFDDQKYPHFVDYSLGLAPGHTRRHRQRRAARAAHVEARP